jgi:hypothetical protein
MEIFGNEILGFISAVQVGVDLKATQSVRVYRLAAYLTFYRGHFVLNSKLFKPVLTF